jgi:transcriptional regulator with XRE-family HTH domain
MGKTYAEREAEILRDPERRARIASEAAAILAANRLARLREQAGLTQTAVARILGISQSRVSKLERAEDLNISTLERYVAALGGELHVDARIGDEVIEMTADEPAVPA